MGMHEQVRYTALGVMSGSSLDGLDLALCTFTLQNGGWTFTIDDARTLPYDAAFQHRLHQVMTGSALDLARMDRDLGDLIGRACREFLAGRQVDVIGSHGHTIFHKPDEGLTLQIGQGARIAAITGLDTVSDFRSLDMALGGQGAPLVPLGEHFLFPAFSVFLNIGGICNVALQRAGRVTGYDVCIGNQALNFLAEEAGRPFDAGGQLARQGQVNEHVLHQLNELPFHRREPPRSLGREWFQEELMPLIADKRVKVEDRLATVVEHIATMVGQALGDGDGPVLLTGGGAHNHFLLERIQARSSRNIEVPGAAVVEFKEALVFAFLGVRRLRMETTAWSSVTGAMRDSSGGSLVSPY